MPRNTRRLLCWHFVLLTFAGLQSRALAEGDGTRNIQARALGEPPAGMDRAQAAACAAGDAPGCVRAARSYEPQGAYRIKLSPKEADARVAGTHRYALRACDLKEAEGCALAAQFGAFKETEPVLSHACELGHIGSCGLLGVRTFSAERLRSLALVEKACRANATGFMESMRQPGAFCHQLAVWYRDVFKDATKAKHFGKLGCTQGYKVDCPCKVDEDCGDFPADEPGEGYRCTNNQCAVVITPC